MTRNFTTISRKEFLKYCAYTAALIGLSEANVSKIAKALAAAAKKPSVIWIEAQDCAGCTISLIGSTAPGAAEIILDTISLRYHETVMAAAGAMAEKVLEDTIEEGGYVLIVEGSIPTVDGRFCTIGGKNVGDNIKKAAEKAAVIIAVGACATYGGIPAAGPTGATGVADFLGRKDVINLSTCPVHTEHLVGTIIYYLLYKKAPELDSFGRPKLFFSPLIHDNCPRRGRFDNSELLVDWNDPAQKDWCLYLKGCKGPFTFSDCPIRKWNDGTNWCIECGAGCQGCSEPDFYAGMSPLYAKAKEVKGIDVDAIGKALGVATAAGLAVHFIGQVATGRLGKGGPPEEGPVERGSE